MSISSKCDHPNDKFQQICLCGETSAMKSKHLGNLSLWFRLTCEMDVLKSFAANQWINQTDNNDTKYMISDGKMPSTIKKKQRKMMHTMAQESSTKTNLHISSNLTEKPITSITIARFKLNNGASDAIQNANDEKQQYFIEYNFLGSRRLRTKSKPLLNNEIRFDFQQIYINDERNTQRLRHILKDPERSIKLMLINALPLERDEHDDLTDSTLDNAEIGFGLMHLSKLVHDWFGSDDNEILSSHSFEIAILSKKPPYQNLGQLEINISNIEILKQIQQTDGM